MTSARYCEPCGVAWPYAVAYTTCPGCSALTTVVPGMVSGLTLDEAEQKAIDMTAARTRREQFEAFCEERDRPRIEAACAAFRSELNAFSGVPE